MKFIITILFSIFLSQSAQATPQIPIEIIKVKDGDTVVAKLENGNTFDIRLYGIDCYENKKILRAYKQAYNDNTSIEDIVEKGLKAKLYLDNMTQNAKNTTFSFMGVDIYKRVLGILYFDDININDNLVEKDFCKSYVYKENL